MEANRGRTATIKLTESADAGHIHISLPTERIKGGLSEGLRNYLELDSVREFLEKLGQRGCPACHSGCDIVIRQGFEEIITVDLETFEVLENTRAVG